MGVLSMVEVFLAISMCLLRLEASRPKKMLYYTKNEKSVCAEVRCGGGHWLFRILLVYKHCHSEKSGGIFWMFC